MRSLPELFKESVRRYPSHNAVITPEENLDFLTLDRISDCVASGLIAKGIVQSDRVALYCINCAEFAAAYLGILKAGATVVPINIMLNVLEIEFILHDADVKALVYHRSFEHNAVQLRSNLPQLCFSIIIGGASSSADDWPGFLSLSHDVPSPNIDAKRDLAVVLYTSGTTGHPKGAMLSHGNLSSNIDSVLEAFEWRHGEETILLVLPMFHAFAATVGMLAPLASGCAFVPLAKFEPDRVARAIADTSATIFLGVPSMYSVLLRLKPDRIKLFESLRYCVSGGAALPIKVLKKFERMFDIKIYEGDGPTECSPVTCVNPIGGLTKPGTVGIPLPRVEMTIFDDDGKEAPLGQVGEIAVRGENVMLGYLNQPEETQKVFHHDWFLTGDLGCQDEDGYFSIVDRKKDLVIVNGMNVYPRVIEEVVHKMAHIMEVAVVGEAHALHGEVPIAYVVVEPDSDVSESDIRAWCQEYLGRYEIPRRIYLVADLPKNATGKILKRELSKRGEVERGIGSLD